MESWRWLARSLALVGVMAWLGVGCGGSSDAPYTHPLLIPANAFTGEVPDSAEYVDPATFGSLLDQGRIKLFTLGDLEKEQQDRLERLEEYKGLADTLYADRPEVLARHTVAPHDGHTGYEALPDGNWRFQVDEEKAVELSGLLYAYQDLVHSTQRFRTKENQLNVYETIHDGLDPDYVLEMDLPDPADVASYTYEEVLELNRTVASDWPAFYPPLTAKKPAGYPGTARAEEGYGGGIDTAFYPFRSGIAAQVDFPLKWFVTSIKDQGRRGTCTAFGVTAAVELMIARDLGRWVNLSEQMLFNRAKQKWEGTIYGDGHSTGQLLFDMTIHQYAYSFEASWDYNRSPQRLKFDALALYMLSCWADAQGAPYAGEHCSDTNHQASMLFTGFGGLAFTAFVNPETNVPPDAGFRILVGNSIGDPGVIGPAWAISMLSVGVPVIISVSVPINSMERAVVAANQDIVPTYPWEPASTGGHCMLLVGFVPDALLPAGVPPSPGMGYFICKNSWDADYGDGGYIYLSDVWVMTFARGLYTVSAVF